METTGIKSRGLSPDAIAPEDRLGLSPKWTARMRLAFSLVGYAGLVLLGYQFAVFDHWAELGTPVALILTGFGIGKLQPMLERNS